MASKRAKFSSGCVSAFCRQRLMSFVRIGAAAIALLAWSDLAAAQTPAAKSVVRFAIPSKGGSFWPNYVAITEGFYANEGIDIQLNVIDPNITINALVGNGVDIAYADSSNMLYALEKNASVVAVGLSTDRQPYRLMAAAPIKTVADLKGKRIGATSDVDVYTYVIKEILRKAKLDPDKDVEWVIGGNQAKRMAAISGEAIDAGLFSPPSDSRLKSQGFNDLAFTPDIYPFLTLSAETVNRDWAQKNGDVLRSVLRAEAKAVQWLNDPANKAKAIQILMTESGSSAADAEEAYKYYIGQHVWTDACIHQEGLVNVVKIMRAMDQLKILTEADVPKFTDAQWCSK